MKTASNSNLKDFVKLFVGPALLNKSLIVFFGIKYSDQPDEGYGYALIAAILVFFVLIGAFLWRYRNIEDP
jgi:hypothetical protein